MSVISSSCQLWAPAWPLYIDIRRALLEHFLSRRKGQRFSRVFLLPINGSSTGLQAASLKTHSFLVHAQVHRKTRALLSNPFAAEAGGAGAAAVACLGAALGTFTPVGKVGDLLATGPSDAPSPLLADLISYCQPPTAPAIALEAFAALREALRNYGTRCVGAWPALSALLGGTLGGSSGGASDDRLVLGGVKALDEFLRCISGGGMDESESASKPQNRADLRQGPKQLPREGGGGQRRKAKRNRARRSGAGSECHVEGGAFEAHAVVAELPDSDGETPHASLQ